MNRFFDPIRRFFTTPQRPPTGVYHYQAPPDDPRNYRLHLRLEEDGSGILIINAATILHLNQTAAEYAYYLVHNTPADQVARNIADSYEVSSEHARQDYLNLAERIQILINTPDLDPITFLDFDRRQPFGGHITAPYRLDCALTYNLPGTGSQAAPVERVKRELSTAEWKTIIDKVWQIGVPHLIFTGGEPTLRHDLPELIAHAETNGQVTGLLSDGLRLADQAYLDHLLQTGLDHVTIILQPENEHTWQALNNALEADIFVAVHLTLTVDNQAQIALWIDRLAEMGVKAISLSASNPSLQEALQAARQQVAYQQLELVWNLPVPYSAMHPVALEDAQENPIEGAGRAWLYIEPDGDVLPAQGINQPCGNLLNDSWENIRAQL